MSQVKTLPITARRWLSLLLCAITAATITVFLSKVDFVQKAYSGWSTILNVNPILHYSAAFLAGIGVKLLLDKFYISHPKRSVGFSWRYPPVTIAVWLSVAALLVYLFVNTAYRPYFLDDALLFSSLKYLHITLFSSALFVLFQETKEKAKKLGGKSWFILFAALVTLLLASGYYHTPWSLITTFILLYCFAVILRFFASSEIKQTHNESSSVGVNSGDDFKDLDDFREWFKDDSTIKSKEKLEPDLQMYAKRITERLRNGGDDYEEDLAQHIALCGPYGCGKSSIVAAIASELKKPKQVKLESSDKEKLTVKQQNKINWIHSDISTWGAASGSVAHVVLSHIIDDISQYIDMCAFRALPKHYTEALKSGGSVFQFASTLLAGPVDIEGGFQKLNDALDTTNHKLLITLQDVDRGTGDENEKRLNDIAALLDKLKNKNLSCINFLIAMGNTKPFYIEIQNKLADHVETIVHHDSKKRLLTWAKLCSEKVFENNMLLPHSFIDSAEQYFKVYPLAFHRNHYHPVTISNNFIDSIRMLKRVMRRVNRCWTENKLLGEVDFGALLLLATLREAEPALFNAFVNSYTSLVNGKSLPIAKIEDGKQRTVNEILFELIADFKNGDAVHLYNAFFKELLNLKEDINEKNGNGLIDHKKSNKQHLGVKPDSVNYLKRILLETVPDNELRDQIVIDSIKSLSTQELAKNICSDYRWQEAFERFGRILFSCDKNQDRVVQIVLGVLQNIGKDPNGFLTEGLFEEYTKQTIDSGNLKGVLNRLVNLESGEKLLELQLERLQRNFEEKTKIIDGNGHYRDIKDEADRREAASYSHKLFQGVNIVNFLSENAHKLSEQSFYVCLRFITFAQLADGEFNFLNSLMKNLLEVVSKNKNTRTVEFLVRAASSQYLTIEHLQEHFSELSPDQREDILQTLAELRDNQENNRTTDLAIEHLSFTEEL